MAPSSDDVQRLRRMTNEKDDTNGYTAAVLSAYIANWLATDSEGRSSGETDWVESYDIHGAAADIWEEKAASLFDKHDFSADSSSYSANQMYTNAMEMARFHRARQKPTSKKVAKRPLENIDPFLYGNVYANIDPLDEDLDQIWKDL